MASDTSRPHGLDALKCFFARLLLNEVTGAEFDGYTDGMPVDAHNLCHALVDHVHHPIPAHSGSECRYALNPTGLLFARALGVVRLEGRCECGLCEYVDSWQAKCDYGYDWPGCRDCFARLDADGWATLSPLYVTREGATDAS